jgi:hypothetical protein
MMDTAAVLSFGNSRKSYGTGLASSCQKRDIMTQPNRRAIIQQVLAEYGYLHWYLVLPHAQDETAGAATKCALFNFRDRTKTEIRIPNRWFYDPRRPMGELIQLGIQNARPLISGYAPDTHLFFLPEPQNDDISRQNDPKIHLPEAEKKQNRRQ